MSKKKPRIRTVTVAQARKAGMCSDYTREMRSLFGERRIPFNRDLALFIVRVVQRGDWVVNWLFTHQQRIVYHRMERNFQPSDHTHDSWMRLTEEMAEAMVAAYSSPR